MAIAEDARTDQVTATGTTSASFTHTPVASAPDLAILVVLDFGTDTVAPSAATYGGTAMQTLKNIGGVANGPGISFFGLIKPPSGAQTVAFTKSTNRYSHALLITFTCATGKLAMWDALGSSTGNTTSLTYNLLPTQTSLLSYDFDFAVQATPPTQTAGGGTNLYSVTEASGTESWIGVRVAGTPVSFTATTGATVQCAAAGITVSEADPYLTCGASVVSPPNVGTPLTGVPANPSNGRFLGDLSLLFVWTTATAATCATPSGWTLLGTFPLQNATANQGKLWVFGQWDVASSTSFSLAGLTTGTTGTPGEAMLGQVRGADPSIAIGSVLDPATPLANSNTAVANIACPSMTTLIDRTMHTVFGIKISNSANGSTAPAGYSAGSGIRLNTGGNDMSSAAFTKIISPAAATGTVTISNTGTTASFGVSFGIKTLSLPTLSTQIPVWRARMPVVRQAGIGAARFS